MKIELCEVRTSFCPWQYEESFKPPEKRENKSKEMKLQFVSQLASKAFVCDTFYGRFDKAKFLLQKKKKSEGKELCILTIVGVLF